LASGHANIGTYLKRIGGRNLIGAGIVTRPDKLEDTSLVAVKSGKLNIDLS
jgi:hypothetical protein